MSYPSVSVDMLGTFVLIRSVNVNSLLRGDRVRDKRADAVPMHRKQRFGDVPFTARLLPDPDAYHTRPLRARDVITGGAIKISNGALDRGVIGGIPALFVSALASFQKIGTIDTCNLGPMRM